MIRLALIGCGKWGVNYVDAIKALDDAELSIICKKSDSALPKHVTQRVTTSLDEALDSGVHGVIISTPPESHLEISKACIERKLPFLLEKPLSLCLSECLELTTLSRESGVPFQMGHIHLYSPAYLRLREVVTNWGSTSLYITSRGGNKGPFRDYDALYDYAPHDISMILGLVEMTGLLLRVRNYSIDRKECHTGTVYRIRMDLGGDAWSDSYIGNGFDTKCRAIHVINKNTGDVVAYNDIVPNRVTINGISLGFDYTSPLIMSMRAFKDMIHGHVDWRTNPDFYDRIYNIVSESS